MASQSHQKSSQTRPRAGDGGGSIPRTASPTARDELRGRTITNSTLQLVKTVGKGGFGTVYRAEDTLSGQIVAVKVINRPLPHQTVHHQLLKTEIKILKAVSQVSLVPTLISVEQDSRFVYLVMHMRGLSSFDVKKRIILRITDALRQCHERSIYHRDLKPENILIGGEGDDVRLIDFGLATDMSISATCRSGTTEYMSPECFSEFNVPGKRSTPYASAPSDVWTLGALLFYAMTGCKLWDKPSFQDEAFGTYVSATDIYFLIKCDTTEDASQFLTQALEWDPLKRLDLSAFQSGLEQLTGFYVSEDEAKKRQPKLFQHPQFLHIPVREAEERYKDHFVKRSELLYACIKDRKALTNALLPRRSCIPSIASSALVQESVRPATPTVTRPAALQGFYSYADSLAKRTRDRLAAAETSSTTTTSGHLCPPSLIFSDSNNPTSGASSVLKSPSASRPRDPPDADVVYVTDGSGGIEGGKAQAMARIATEYNSDRGVVLSRGGIMGGKATAPLKSSKGKGVAASLQSFWRFGRSAL
ncbi:kinase-like protein [Clavulina sp. PMI_390]|nr:kinase-like protein [Clavulina sp. PMI_390]